jgi:hypothetical protein
VTQLYQKVPPLNDMPEARNMLKCPFCENRYLTAKPGVTRCSVCGATFENDDRLECAFVDTDDIRLPAYGTVCPSCGLVQGGENRNCLYCGIEINTNNNMLQASSEKQRLASVARLLKAES